MASLPDYKKYHALNLIKLVLCKIHFKFDLFCVIEL